MSVIVIMVEGHIEERGTAVREVGGSSPRPKQHSVKQSNLYG